MGNGLENTYVVRDNREMKCGYTTGSCAAAAACAAAKLLLTGQRMCKVKLLTPKGIWLFLETQQMTLAGEWACCAIRKEAGDDPDVTDGALVFADVRKCSHSEALALARVYGDPGAEAEEEAAIGITGGEGVGRVTLPGLQQPVGAPAINRTPRAMIADAVRAVCQECGYTNGIEVRIRVPGGEMLAQKTFNPRLGVVGGISILGTSGIVEPMSEQALVDTIRLELRQKAALGHRYLLVTPGNYGTEYLRGHFPFQADEAVKCSNYVGQTIDMAVDMGFRGLLFVAHIGKFVKVAGGIMNTHSREADARMEILAASAFRVGADREVIKRILDAVTTNEGLGILNGVALREMAMLDMIGKIDIHLKRRAQGRLQIGAVVFSDVYGELGRTADAEELLQQLLWEKKDENSEDHVVHGGGHASVGADGRSTENRI